jgi:hypothetical protein
VAMPAKPATARPELRARVASFERVFMVLIQLSSSW